MAGSKKSDVYLFSPATGLYDKVAFVLWLDLAGDLEQSVFLLALLSTLVYLFEIALIAIYLFYIYYVLFVYEGLIILGALTIIFLVIIFVIDFLRGYSLITYEFT